MADKNPSSFDWLSKLEAHSVLTSEVLSASTSAVPPPPSRRKPPWYVYTLLFSSIGLCVYLRIDVCSSIMVTSCDGRRRRRKRLHLRLLSPPSLAVASRRRRSSSSSSISICVVYSAFIIVGNSIK